MDGSLNLGNSCGFFPTGWWNQNRVIAVTDIFESIVIPGKNKDLEKLVNCPDFYPIDAPYSHTFFYKIHASAFDGIVARNLEIQTKINLAITACAVERFRLKNNRLPDSIAELKAADLGVIRDDFYNPAGGPLQYRKDSDNGRYLLYSFGSHQIDNGGTSNPRSSDSPFSKVDRKTSDIVWRYSSPKNPEAEGTLRFRKMESCTVKFSFHEPTLLIRRTYPVGSKRLFEPTLLSQLIDPVRSKSRANLRH